MHTAIVYYNHDKLAIFYYNESDGNWDIILDKIFAMSTPINIYNAIIGSLYDLLIDFNDCSENDSFDFSEFIHNYDSDFYLVEVK